MLLYTCAPSGVWPLRVFLVIVGLQDVAVLGHHEDWDEVNNSKRQKLSLFTVLLKQTTYTKWSVGTSSLENSDSWGVTWLFCIFFFCSTHNISEDNSPEAVDIHVLKKPVQISDGRHSTCHCVNWTLHVCMEIKLSPSWMCTFTAITVFINPCALHGIG